MANLEKPMFGNIKGKFGKAVFRQRNGLNYIAQRPSSYSIPGTESYLIRTAKFRICAKISSALNSVSLLKELWKEETPEKLSTYNYLISVNYGAVNNDLSLGLIKIAPDSAVGVRLDTVALTSDKLTVNLLPLTEKSLINPSVEKKVKLASLLYLSSPLNSEDSGFEVITFISASKAFDLASPLTFDLFISTSDELKIGLYRNKSVHSSLITFAEDDTAVNNSSTFSHTVV